MQSLSEQIEDGYSLIFRSGNWLGYKKPEILQPFESRRRFFVSV